MPEVRTTALAGAEARESITFNWTVVLALQVGSFTGQNRPLYKINALNFCIWHSDLKI